MCRYTHLLQLPTAGPRFGLLQLLLRYYGYVVVDLGPSLVTQTVTRSLPGFEAYPAFTLH